MPKTKSIEKIQGWVDTFRTDSWQNLLTGLGTIWDKGRWTSPRMTAFLDPETLESLFDNDPFARRIVEDPVDAAFREGFEVVSEGSWIKGSERAKSWYWYEPDPEIAKREKIDIEHEFKRLSAVANIVKLIVYGRLWGREAIFIGADDGKSPDQPLDITRVKSVRFLEIIDRRDFYPKSYQKDPDAPNFGEPETWLVNRSSGTVSGSAVEIHSSRLLMAGGVLTSRRKRMENEWCDASVLQAVYSQLQKFNTDDMSVSSMMMDSSQAILKIRNFVKILSGKDKDTLKTRMDIVDRGRSVSRIMPIDAELEDFAYVDRTFAGVHELLEKRQQTLAGAVGWPSVILFGRSPAGLSATGEADIRAWYDSINADRTSKYQPLIEQLLEIVCVACEVTEPSSWSVVWPSLWQESPIEKATRQKMVADTDAIYLDRGVTSEDEIATARYGGGEWSDQAPQLDFEMREALREQDLKRAQGEYEMPEPPPQIPPQSEEDPDDSDENPEDDPEEE